MDFVRFVISVLRFSIAAVATVFFFLFHAILFILNALVVVVTFPFAVVLMSRADLKQSWYSTYPNG